MRLVGVELRPEDPSPGGQVVVLSNGSDRPVEVDCWIVRSEGTGRSARIRAKAAIAPASYLRLLPDTALFDSDDTVSLWDGQGRPVDRTPRLTDRAGDDRLWFRRPGGTWTFDRGFQLSGQVIDGRLLAGAGGC